MSIFFTSDTHFDHKNIMKYSKRPFSSVDEMNRVMIENWNRKVSNTDSIYFLGDLAFGDAHFANNVVNQLNGRKHFIRGNHDSVLNDKNFDRSQFEWIKDYYVLRHNDMKIVLFHYPIQEWDGMFHGSIHLYGHVHNNPFTGMKGSYNVGVDVNNYEPVSLEEILKKLR
jgi:calcineurin-like phosphoesterase family protein